ncbi:SLIT and NTRK-like protein 1 [Polypterus senegalus]|uniref:SLIT and NTRK-like protein 1 n=1 Tax=Polypterus senegalus TaxID=55291 RepID=UPI001965E4E8|nr:SLIT and NTRK-like protein 1 [Polypterus senegalus]
MLLWILLLKAALCVATGNVTRDVCKEQICSCNEIEGDLHIDCEKRSFSNLHHLTAPSSQFYHLLLHGNSLTRLFPNEFANFYNAVSLHLENNGLHEIVPGAFLGLQLVKRLHINNNKIRAFKKNTFLGLDDLEYMQADFNLLRDIDPGVFRDLNKLEVLILNDNLISALPTNVFQHVPITHLDLRGNRIKTLPYEGVLEQIPGIAEILLEDNPWDCSCDLVSLKEWLENIPKNALIGRVICEAPTRLQGNDLNETSEHDLCPSKNGIDPSLEVPPTQEETCDPGPIPTPFRISGEAEPSTYGPSHKDRVKSRGNWRLKTIQPSRVVTINGKGDPPYNDLCPLSCTCELQESNPGLKVNCKGKELESLADLKPKPSNVQELNLRDNSVHTVRKAHFIGYQNLNLLDLGNNVIKVIENGTFQNLTELRWLYFDKNYLESLMSEMFAGLQNLEYLNLEYNSIQLILPGTFNSMPNLRVLILNNNLMKSLPVDVFIGVSLSKISLHNNYFAFLPVSGVLDQLVSIIQIDLHGNPWDCTCNIVPFKQWTERLGPEVIVSDLKCELPEEFLDKDFRSLRNDAMCPRLYDKIFPTSLSKNSTAIVDTGTRSNSYLETSRVSISVLVPGLLLVFVTSAFTVVGMLVFILRNRKRSKRRDANSSASEINSLQTVCDSSYWHSGPYHADGSHRVYECGTHSLSD